jgi:hypothetical protein
MSVFDQQNLFSDSQVLTATANSSNLIDALVARNLGAGEPIFLLAGLIAISGTSPTLTVNLVGADDPGFSTNKITIATATPTLVSGTPQTVHLTPPSHTPKRYFRLEFTVGGTTPSITVIAGFLFDRFQPALTPIGY